MRQNENMIGVGNMNVLFVAFEGARWGAARLVKPLGDAGFNVAALCPRDNPLAQTRFLRRCFALASIMNARRIEQALAAAMRDWQPRLIIPGDERAVACLQALLRRIRRGGKTSLSPAAVEVLGVSLGNPERFDAMMLKSDTVRLARELGVKVPAGATVASAREAVVIAERIGFPVFVKRSFSWAGLGVTRCDDADELTAAFEATQVHRRVPFHATLKRILHRDWNPTISTVDVQQAVRGVPAFYCTVALNGRMLAGIAGVARRTCAATGPSSMVWLGPHDAMAHAAARMIGALGATGFIGFDFMVEAQTGAVYLLECNPRPTPVCHLGGRLGVDLCAALAAGLHGAAGPARAPLHEETIALFPQEWLRDARGLDGFEGFVDVPFDDPALVCAMLGKPPSTTNPVPPELDRRACIPATSGLAIAADRRARPRLVAA
jgi:hypothetical protein